MVLADDNFLIIVAAVEEGQHIQLVVTSIGMASEHQNKYCIRGNFQET